LDPNELPVAHDEAFFALSRVYAIGDPVQAANRWYIYKLLATTASRDIDASRLQRITSLGYDRWFAEQKQGSQIWIDPEFAPAPSTPATA
jgi:hypothetical protein